MTKLSKDEIAAIVKKHGFRLVPEQRTDTRQVETEGRTPELAKVKAKYARGRGTADAERCDEPAAAIGTDAAISDDDSIVVVEPEMKRDAFTRANRPKAKVISGAKKDITGSQG